LADCIDKQKDMSDLREMLKIKKGGVLLKECQLSVNKYTTNF